MYRTEIVLNNFEFGQKPNGNSSTNSYQAPKQASQPKQEKAPKQNAEIDYPDQEIDPEDIPF
jgi:single-stranded DNA-binding protein